ncbi:RE1 [Symbiodinium sp. CCMP2592]|nr:RE1 [Symbiodinium sp. CCMP2592]
MPGGGEIQGSQPQSSAPSHGTSWRDRDPPPAFDGRNPDRAYPKWKKELDLWKFETEVPKEKWGVKVWRQLEGSARAVADGLTFEELACEKGLENLLKVLEEHYSPHLEVSLPKAFEDAIYGNLRSHKESFSDYVIRMEHAMKELERQGVKLHDIAVGYVMFRHANLSDVQESQLLTWGAGKYDRKTVVTNLRRLDKGAFDVKRKSAHYLTEGDEETEDPHGEMAEIYHQQEDVADSDLDEEYVYIGEDDLKEIYEEEHVMEALATYQDIRKSIRDQRNSRGYFPTGKGGKRDHGKDRGKGVGKQKPVLDIKGAPKNPMKFSGKGTKVHVDLLKLRTKCARCGVVGHWARECRNPPDERGRQSTYRSAPSTTQSSVSSPSARSGFYVETTPADRMDSSSFFGENRSDCYMSYIPTFGRLMFSVVGKSARALPDKPPAENPESFVGVTTTAGEGIVDTAAQDGLVGKAALLQLTEALRSFGLQIRWNTQKKAQASGVGGKAKVIGIAEIPIGIAGVNGLLEVTVVQDNVPLLLPIRLLRQLRAIVDLDRDVLQLKAYRVETPMHSLPSGHMSISVTSYAPEGWSLPHAAASQSLKHDEYVLMTTGFLNQSMYPLEGSSVKTLKFDIGDDNGESPPAPNAGPEDEGRTDASRRTASCCATQQKGNQEVEVPRRSAVRLDAPGESPNKGFRMAARWVFAALGAGNLSNAGYQVAPYLGQRKTKDAPTTSMTECTHPAHELKGAGNQYSKEIWCGRCKARWEYLNPEKLAQAEMEKNMAVRNPPMVDGASLARGSEEQLVVCNCKNPATKWEVRKAGPTKGRHFYRCRQRLCDFFLWDPMEQERIRSAGQMQEPLQMEVEANRENVEQVRNQMETMMNAQAVAHQRELEELRTQLAWMQGFAQQWQMAQNPEMGSMDGFQMVQARRKQMQAFCLRAPAPWMMTLSRDYYIWDESNYSWVHQFGWLPRELRDRKFLAVFDDLQSMTMWSDQYGKLKALTAGEKKKSMKALDNATKASSSTVKYEVLEAVSPATISCFVEYDNAMANLDPCCSNQFWTELRNRSPNLLILRPNRDEGSHELAVEAAEWQHAQGKTFAVMCSEVSERVEDDLWNLGESMVHRMLPSEERVWSNDFEFANKLYHVMSEDRVLNHEDTNDLQQNSKAHQSVECEAQSVYEVDVEQMSEVLENQFVFHEDTDDLQQNSKAHQHGAGYLDLNCCGTECRDSLGKHRGGGLWTEDSGAESEGKYKAVWKKLDNGEWVQGKINDIHYKVNKFDPKKWHGSEEWSGQRFVVSAFTSRALDQVDPQKLNELKKLGFPLPRRNFVYMFNGSKQCVDNVNSEVYVGEDDGEPVGDEVPEGDLDLPDPDPLPQDPNSELEPSQEEKRLLKKLHENMGHPAPRELAKMYEPGRVVGVDVIFLSGLDRRQSFPALNIVDWGTGYSMVERLKNTEATHAWRTFQRTWARTFGIPEVIVADLGTEFRGQFAELAGQSGALIRHTAARSPWQAGKTERAGAHYKQVYDKARESTFVSSWEEIKTLMYEVESARNRYGNRSGFSPMQRQIGHNLRLPGSLLSDDHLDPQLVIESSGDEMRRVLEIRKAAQEAYIKSQTETAITRAKNARSAESSADMLPVKNRRDFPLVKRMNKLVVDYLLVILQMMEGLQGELEYRIQLKFQYQKMRSVQRNEELDGNFKRQRGWFYFEEGKWKFEKDEWEFVNPNDDGSVEKMTDLWFKERKKNGKTKGSWVGFTVFSNKEVNLENYLATKARGQGEVFEHEITPEEWPAWQKTDRSEWDKVVETGAIRVLDLERSLEIRNGPEKDRIIPSRMVRRWKPGEQPGDPETMKSRWCLRGDRDPDLLDLDRHAPTLNTTSFGVLLQIAASMRYKATIGDLKNAFCQSLPLVRKNGALYASLPRGGIQGLHELQLVEIVAGVYGLGDSPKHWRRTLREAILGLGYRESVMDPTVYFHQSRGVLNGAIAVEVDDLFTFGNSVHSEKMQQLQQKFKFGKYEDVMLAKDGVGFNGRRIRQKENYEFEVDMHKFVCERLSPVQLSKGRRSEPKALANDSEINQMRAVIGALNWLAKEGRPDAAAAASLGASTFPRPVVQDILDVNAAVKLLKERPELTIRIRSIDMERLSWGVISDASFGNAHAGHSQGAYAVLAFDEIQKVVNSTLAAETQSLSKGLGELSWIVTLFNELTDVNFELVDWEERLKKNRMIAMAPDCSSDGLKSSLCIIDAKALFDHLSRETTGPSQDKRTGLEIQVVRQHMNAIAGEVRWIPHPQMIVDGLTKKGSNMKALYELLDSGEFQIVDMAEALEEKRKEREQLGYNKR